MKISYKYYILSKYNKMNIISKYNKIYILSKYHKMIFVKIFLDQFNLKK